MIGKSQHLHSTRLQVSTFCTQPIGVTPSKLLASLPGFFAPIGFSKPYTMFELRIELRIFTNDVPPNGLLTMSLVAWKPLKKLWCWSVKVFPPSNDGFGAYFDSAGEKQHETHQGTAPAMSIEIGQECYRSDDWFTGKNRQEQCPAGNYKYVCLSQKWQIQNFGMLTRAAKLMKVAICIWHKDTGTFVGNSSTP